MVSEKLKNKWDERPKWADNFLWILSTLLVFVGVSNFMIENKLSDPEFIRVVAGHIGKQTILLDSKGSIINGFHKTANAFLESKPKIVFNERNEVVKIVLNFKDMLPVPPVIETLNADFVFSDGLETNSNTYEYERIDPSTSFMDQFSEESRGKKPKPKYWILIITP